MAPTPRRCSTPLAPYRSVPQLAYLLDAKDAEAIELLAPLLVGSMAGSKHHRAQLCHACYNLGCARYHTRDKSGAIACLLRAFELRDTLVSEGEDCPPFALGDALGRFYLAHALFNSGKLDVAKTTIHTYIADVGAAGPQKVLNMPSGWGGKVVSDNERKASRFRARACSDEAQADAYTMLAMIAEREEGPVAAIAHCHTCLKLAGNDQQRVDAHSNLAGYLEMVGETAEAAEHTAKAAEFREKVAEAAAEAARKKAEAEKEDEQQAQEAADTAADGAAGEAAGEVAGEAAGEAAPVPVE